MKTLPLCLSLTTTLACAVFLTSCGKNETVTAAGKVSATAQPRLTAARRHFMTNTPALQETAGKQLIEKVEMWLTLGEMKSAAPPPSGPAPDAQKITEMEAELARTIEQMCEDTASLTLPGRAKRDFWEARAWRGYLLPDDFTTGEYPASSGLYQGPDAARQEKCETDFLTKQETLLKTVREEAVARVQAKAALMKKHYGPGATRPDDAGKEAFLDQMRALTVKENVAAGRLHTLSLDAAKHLAEWRYHDWDGYQIPGSVDLPAVMEELSKVILAALQPNSGPPALSPAAAAARQDFLRRRNAAWQTLTQPIVSEMKRLQKEVEDLIKNERPDLTPEKALQLLETRGKADGPALQKLAKDARAHLDETVNHTTAWDAKKWEGYAAPADPAAPAPAPPP